MSGSSNLVTTRNNKVIDIPSTSPLVNTEDDGGMIKVDIDFKISGSIALWTLFPIGMLLFAGLIILIVTLST